MRSVSKAAFRGSTSFWLTRSAIAAGLIAAMFSLGVNSVTADPSTGSISGTVTDAADPSGLSGVCVTAASSDGGVTGTATTAGDGTYAISGLAPDTYNVEFDPTCGGSIASADVAQWFEMAVTKFAGSPVTVTSGGTASGTDADLAAGGSISGTVTDAADPSGLSGVCVTAASSDGGVTGTATTAGDGTYAISGLAPDTYNVEFDPTCGGSIASADVAQSTTSPVTVTSGGTASGTDADLAAGGSISGTVTDAADPSGLSGVCVTATSSDGETGTGTATTAGDGTYAISGLAPDTYNVEFDPTCGGSIASADVAQSTTSPVTVTSGGTASGTDADLAAGGSISGTVTDAADPSGLSGVCVTATSSDGETGTGTATTAGDGTYAISGLAPDTYNVEFDPTCGGSIASADVAQSTTSPVTVTSGGTASGTDADLAAGGSISGTVTDAADPSGLSGVCVTATSSDGETGTGTATTAGDGTYAISGLAPDTYNVEFDPTCGGSIASADVAQSTTSPVTVTSGGTASGTDAHLAPGSGGSISGTVTDAADPSGLSGVCVTAASSDGGVTGTATTAGDGTYAISGLAPDTYNVEFDPTCGGSIASADVAQSTTSPVTVTSGGTASGTDADLAAGGSISGTVTDAADPSGLSGVCVTATSSDGETGTGTATTAGDGTYAISGLAPDTYNVEFDPTCGGSIASADVAQSTTSPVTVTSGGTASGTDADLAAGGSISGTVTDAADPSGLSGVCVTATSSDGETGTGTATTAGDGTYAISGLAPDTYNVEFDPTCGGSIASADVAQSTTSPVTVTSGGTASGTDADLAAGGSISGTVTDAADPSGLSGVCVTATSSDGLEDATVETGSHGTYAISGLAPDTYNVEFDPTCGNTLGSVDLPQLTSDPVSVQSASSTDGVDALLITSAGSGSISGRVTDAADPSGLSGVCVTATSSDGETGTGTATTAGDGTYAISGLAPDTYNVEFDPTCGGSIASADVAQSTTSPVTVTSGGTAASVNAELAKRASSPPPPPVITSPSNPTTHGYWLVGSDGGIFTFGSSQILRVDREPEAPATRRRDRPHCGSCRLLARCL